MSKQLFLMKGGHYYIFKYEPGQESLMMDTLVQKAEDPRCPLDWMDVAILSSQLKVDLGTPTIQSCVDLAKHLPRDGDK